MDRYDLYDLCVTEPERMTRFLVAAHGRSPRVFREDFAGTAALARYWAEHVRGGSAVAVDHDAEPLARARDTVKCVVSDVIRCREKADVIAWTNFSVGHLHTRTELVSHLKHARRSLHDGGILVVDTYGGAHAFQHGRHIREVTGPNKEHIEYAFEQREANAFTGRVVDALHFRVQRKGSPRAQLFKDAFVYEWRLWSVTELTDAMQEAGFSSGEVHDRSGVAMDQRGKLRLSISPAPSDEDWVALLVARK